MAHQNRSLQSSKKRSHSSPELLATGISRANPPSDENIKRILDEFNEIRGNDASATGTEESSCSQSQMKADVIPADSNRNSLEKDCKIRAGLRKLKNFFAGKVDTVQDNADGGNVCRPRSQSVSTAWFASRKSQQRPDPSSDGSSTSSPKECIRRSKRNDKKWKCCRGRSKNRSWRNSLAASRTESRDDASKSQVDPSLASSAENAQAPVADNSPVRTPALNVIPVTLADMFRNHDQQQILERTTIANYVPDQNIPSNPEVVTTTQNIYAHYDSLLQNGTFSHRTVHTQIDYMHCLIPDQWGILNAPFYWGQIDRFQADDLLEGKPEGTFILRDSTQYEFVFSVSFRRYGRTLHARIEQWNHKFTFDANDSGVRNSKTICGLLEHYKDPSFCMFFEPMLSVPLLKKNPQSLQELCRARLCSDIKYNDISNLKLPIAIREYLRIYHYKQRLRVRKMEVDDVELDTSENSPGVITNTCLSNVHAITL